MSRRPRVLVLVQGPLGDRLMGPEIRGWEIARAFAAAGNPVTVAASVPGRIEREGLPVVPRTRRSILAELRRHDVIVGPTIPPYALTSPASCLRVADLYDPVDLELSTLSGRAARRSYTQQRASRQLHLRWADAVVCANERQLQRTRDDLAEVARPGDPPAMLSVPMGLPPSPPAGAGDGHPLRAPFSAIGAGDPLVLWWGTMWRWLDPATAIDAVERLARRRPDVRLIVTAGKPANAATDPLNIGDDMRALARDRGLLDRHVFFFDDWIPFEERHRYLADADVGITLHAATAEAPLAARARYMDYLWASLPSVLAEGDEVADELGDRGAARLVPPCDAAATADALEALLADPAARQAARRACAAAAEAYSWPVLLAPLVDLVQERAPTPRGARQQLSARRGAGSYYARRAVDHMLAALPERG
jgi:glycosyltransferase involved in cell wall biosynthesis